MPAVLLALLKALRPTHWTKNAFVLAPLLFARRWSDPVAVRRALLAMLLWCLAASAVYLFNDVRDREADRAHPLKRRRPIASGALPIGLALAAALALAAGGLGVAATFLSPLFAAALGAYLGIHLLYSLGLKAIPYLDVVLVAAGFVLRVLGGALAIPVPASLWLLLCSAGLSLFLALAKRRAERARVAGGEASARSVMRHYEVHHLDRLLGATALATTLAYLAYTVAPTTVAHVGDARMLATLPFVAAGHLRYLHLVRQRGEGEDPTRLARKDPWLLVIVVGWVATSVLALWR
jgi:4-hydroxybenzoate polyprenyltransferase